MGASRIKQIDLDSKRIKQLEKSIGRLQKDLDRNPEDSGVKDALYACAYEQLLLQRRLNWLLRG